MGDADLGYKQRIAVDLQRYDFAIFLLPGDIVWPGSWLLSAKR